MNELFRKFAHRMSLLVGSPWAFVAAVTLIIGWLATGPLFDFSDTWQLVINTTTTIVTFLMVFLIQNTQNRDAKAIHLKLDELIRAVKNARNTLVDLEDVSDDELEEFQKEFRRFRERQEHPAENGTRTTRRKQATKKTANKDSPAKGSPR
ncbi:MAG TPA: low affinity iron permease family protein [Anaerolineae bacterium]|nr:low affinity iron permease family protein [Anaerolineae bacterium]